MVVLDCNEYVFSMRVRSVGRTVAGSSSRSIVLAPEGCSVDL